MIVFRTIDQGLAVYREELRQYAAFTDGLHAKYGVRLSNVGASAVCHDQDLRKVETWNARMKGMEEALGLSKEEADTINAEIPKATFKNPPSP